MSALHFKTKTEGLVSPSVYGYKCAVGAGVVAVSQEGHLSDSG